MVRCTVTDQNVDRLPELVDFYVKETGTRLIHFEVAFLSGRCLQHSSHIPAPEVFARRYVEARIGPPSLERRSGSRRPD